MTTEQKIRYARNLALELEFPTWGRGRDEFLSLVDELVAVVGELIDHGVYRYEVGDLVRRIQEDNYHEDFDVDEDVGALIPLVVLAAARNS